MNEIRYLISDASKKVDVETHVLRYWEEELGLSIPRNEMGHRYYTEFHIRLFCQIKKLKDRGYQLKAIKNALQQVMSQDQGFMQAAGILEEDMARTLQENQSFSFVIDKEGRFEGITRLSDYNRLEPGGEELTEDNTVRKEEDELGFKEKNKQDADKDEEEKMQNKPEIKEKDGQIEMKKKGKNRKKPSAWERRNGITGNEQDIGRESDGETLQQKEEREERLQQNETWESMLRNDRQAESVLDNELIEEDQTKEKESFSETEDLSAAAANVRNDAHLEADTSLHTEIHLNSDMTELARASSDQVSILSMDQDEKMEKFQNIMNHIIGHALEANNEKLSQEISSLVNARLSEELEDLMRIRDERDEERFRQFDEIIRSYQRDSQGKAEAAAAKIPFFRRRHFKKSRHPQNV